MSTKRCLNIDWLEVYCLEPLKIPRDPDYYSMQNWQVKVREYGTRVYQQMFTLIGTDGYPLLEIRRKPFGDNSEHSVLPANAAHIRIVNRACYYCDIIDKLNQFLTAHDYDLQRISRIDLCLDFEYFDSGDDPQKFIRRYMDGKYSKVNQSNVHAHGLDMWDGRQWNSLSWGKHKSPVSTKLYNKTMELEQVHDKPYIRRAWFDAGLIADPYNMMSLRADGTAYKPAIWRLEFSVKSAVKNWVTCEKDGQERKYISLPNKLEIYANSSLMLTLFASLCQHYFHFKKFVDGKSKYECQDKVLFKFDNEDLVIRPEHPASDKQPDSFIQRLLALLKAYRNTVLEEDTRGHIDALIKKLEGTDEARLCANIYSKAELMALQATIALKLAGATDDPVKMEKSILAKIIENHKQIY